MRKDDDPTPAPIKTITNYFLPKPKPVDKPFSPSRSNSIKEYFQKTPPAQERTTSSHKCSPFQPKELQLSSSQEVSSGLSRASRQKRTRKTKEKQSKLQEEEQDMLADRSIVEFSNESVIKEGSVSLLGSDTAALLSQINNEICLAVEDDGKAKDELKNRKWKNTATQSLSEENICNDDATSQEDRCRIKKSAVRRNRKPNTSQGKMCNAEPEQSRQDTSMEVNMDETSLLSCSTVTVSFEEFLESQLQDAATTETKSDTCTAKSSEVKSCTDTSDLAVSVSPRTLTIQAEVHPVSPDHESVKGPQLKMASIFTRNKKESQFMDDKKFSVNLQANTDILPDLKRKSNVVLHEEDLELAVVESSSTPKCNPEERKQFMNAFKQPSLDGSKGKPSKSLNKSKPSKENETEEPEKRPDESNPDLTTAESGTEQKSTKGAGKKRGRKPGKKEQTHQSEEVPVAPKQDKHLTSTEVENKSDSVDDSDRRRVKELRRSTRDQTRKQGTSSVPETNPSPRKTRSHEKPETSAVVQDDVAQASTPKSHRHKKNVYRAEMLAPLDKRGSPIRCVLDACV